MHDHGDVVLVPSADVEDLDVLFYGALVLTVLVIGCLLDTNSFASRLKFLRFLLCSTVQSVLRCCSRSITYIVLLFVFTYSVVLLIVCALLCMFCFVLDIFLRFSSCCMLYRENLFYLWYSGLL